MGCRGVGEAEGRWRQEGADNLLTFDSLSAAQPRAEKNLPPTEDVK